MHYTVGALTRMQTHTHARARVQARTHAHASEQRPVSKLS